jgi:hypothetical protein
MLIATDHRAHTLPGLAPAAPAFSFVDPTQVEQPAPEAYEHWRMWRYEHVSLDAQLWIHEMGAAMWAAKRPWWVSL